MCNVDLVINKDKIILWGPSIGGAVSTYMALFATQLNKNIKKNISNT